jgi:hypothetical protein
VKSIPKVVSGCGRYEMGVIEFASRSSDPVLLVSEMTTPFVSTADAIE